jgi:hypothetical protein
VDRETGEERVELLAPKLSIAETSVQRACTLLPRFRARRYRATGQSTSNGAPPDKGEASGKVGTVRLSGWDQRRYRRD